MKIGSLISLMILIVLIAASAALTEEKAKSVVVVTAIGKDEIEPDKIRVSFMVELMKKTPDEAVEAAADAYKQVLAALNAVGFGLERVITSQYDVNPLRHEKKRKKIIGYRAIQSLRVVTSDPDSIGLILDQIIGIKGTRIRDIRYTSTKLDSIRRVALAEAVKNARADAAVMADAVGGELGELIEITTHYPDNPTYGREGGFERIALKSNRAVPTPLTPERISINVSILGRWRFVEKMPEGESAR